MNQGRYLITERLAASRRQHGEAVSRTERCQDGRFLRRSEVGVPPNALQYLPGRGQGGLDQSHDARCQRRIRDLSSTLFREVHYPAADASLERQMRVFLCGLIAAVAALLPWTGLEGQNRQIIVIGSVVDSTSNRPIDKVDVYLPDDAATKTNGDG